MVRAVKTRVSSNYNIEQAKAKLKSNISLTTYNNLPKMVGIVQ